MTFVPPVLGSGLVVWPYDPADFSLADWTQVILDEMVAHPTFFSKPTTPDERRKLAAAILANRANLHWGVWRAGDNAPILVGVLTLWQVEPEVDALFHFLFFDRNLVGKRTLLARFIGYCFTTLGFRRLTATIPEDADKLLRFYRKLGFRYEGESRATGLTPTAFLAAGAPGLRAIENAPQWLAKQGSRTEGVFWRDDQWIDVLRLRLLRPEYEGDHHADRSRRSSSTSRGEPRR